MTETKLNLTELLDYVDPAMLSYQEWVDVGMALKQEGYTASDWDAWSQQDSGRYHPGETWKKWETFNGTGNPVTGATITQMAKEHGWTPGVNSHELDWNDTIDKDDLRIIDNNWLEGREIEPPKDWDPAKEITTYLSTLFDSTDYVGYVMQSYYNEENKRYLPKKGNYDRTAGELIQLLNQSKTATLVLF